ncbi:MAG TPA: PQQ-binding-like beta-propeller repeat protein [bacterium]|nr:PQQ-binding-like beta-propeller repeat protein [bacterium]HOL93375.1 PQQ-binding-like beta-propeller repeat protein [bacterium]
MTQETKNRPTVWRTSGGDNTRRGCYRGKAATAAQAGHPQSILRAQGGVRASVVFDARNTAYIADMAGSIQACGEEGGATWVTGLEGGIAASPVLSPDDAQLYAATVRGYLYALDASSGQTAWRVSIPSKTDPRILSDLLHLPRLNAIVLNSWGGNFYAIDAGNGQIISSWSAGITPYAAAAADPEEHVYCLRAVWEPAGIQFVRIDPVTGKEEVMHFESKKTRPPSRMTVAAAPVLDIERNVVYFITNLDKECLLFAYSLQSGAVLWNHPLSRYVQAIPCLRPDGSVVIADLHGEIQVFAPDGSRRFRCPTGTDYLEAGAVCDQSGWIYLGDPEGHVHALNPNGVDRVLFEAERAIEGRPSFDNRGYLFIPSMDSNIYIF